MRSSSNAKSAIAASKHSKVFQSTYMAVNSKTRPKTIDHLRNNSKCDTLVPTVFSLAANTHIFSRYDVNFLSHRRYHTSTHYFESKKNDSVSRTQKDDDHVSSLYDRVKSLRISQAKNQLSCESVSRWFLVVFLS